MEQGHDNGTGTHCELATVTGEPLWLVPIWDWHFYQRVYSRYGFELVAGDYELILSQIIAGRAILLRKGTLSSAASSSTPCDVFAVPFRNVFLHVAVTDDRTRLITAFPPAGKKIFWRDNLTKKYRDARGRRPRFIKVEDDD